MGFGLGLPRLLSGGLGCQLGPPRSLSGGLGFQLGPLRLLSGGLGPNFDDSTALLRHLGRNSTTVQHLWALWAKVRRQYCCTVVSVPKMRSQNAFPIFGLGMGQILTTVQHFCAIWADIRRQYSTFGPSGPKFDDSIALLERSRPPHPGWGRGGA